MRPGKVSFNWWLNGRIDTEVHAPSSCLSTQQCIMDIKEIGHGSIARRGDLRLLCKSEKGLPPS